MTSQTTEETLGCSVSECLCAQTGDRETFLQEHDEADGQHP